MDYDYYYEDSKSEADEIIEEAKDKIAEIIYQKAKEEITHIQDAYEIQKKNYNDAMNKVGELTQQNIIKDKEIEKLKSKLESGDSKSLTNLPIAIGDKVWVVVYANDDEITCPVCGGVRIRELSEGYIDHDSDYGSYDNFMRYNGLDLNSFVFAKKAKAHFEFNG